MHINGCMRMYVCVCVQNLVPGHAEEEDEDEDEDADEVKDVEEED